MEPSYEHEIFNIQQHLDLTKSGIPLASFGHVHLESEHFFCVNTAQQVHIFDLQSGNCQEMLQVEGQFECASVIISRDGKKLAMRSTDPEQGIRIVHRDRNNEIQVRSTTKAIMFWKWITDNTVAFVTGKAVYRFNVNRSIFEKPTLVFRRHPLLAECEIKDMVTTLGTKWAVTGHFPEQAGAVKQPIVQLFTSGVHGADQVVEGVCVCTFAFTTLPLNHSPSFLFVFASRSTNSPGTLTMLEVGKPSQRLQPYLSTVTNIPSSRSHAKGDFPVALQALEHYEAVCLLTHFGHIHLYDLQTGSCLHESRSPDKTLSRRILSTVRLQTLNSILVATTHGLVLSIAVDQQRYVATSIRIRKKKRSEAMLQFAIRNKFAGTEDLQQVRQGNIQEPISVDDKNLPTPIELGVEPESP